MRSKNSKHITEKEKKHLYNIKNMDCACCGNAGPSQAHHIRQGNHYSCIPLCFSCHMPPIGIHGDRSMMKVYKTDELLMLFDTVMKISNDK